MPGSVPQDVNTTADNPKRAPTLAPPVRGLDSPAVAALPHDALSDLSGAELRRAMSVVTIAWIFGAIWMHALAGAPLTVFANALGASNFDFGLLAALPFLAQLMSVPASVLTDRTGKRRTIFLIGLYANRVLWFAIALVPIGILIGYGPSYSPLAVFAFLTLVFLMQMGQAIGSPAWVSWMADIVPDRVRGRYFARRRQWGILSAVPAALIAGYLLDRYGGASTHTVLWTCGGIFMVAAVFGIVDIAMFHLVPHADRPKPRQPIVRQLFHPLKNRRFVWFSACAAILWFAVAGQAVFVSKFLIDRLGISSTGVQMIVLVTPLLMQLLVLPIWGKAIDRYGKKPAMIVGVLGMVPVGAGWVLMNSGHVWLGYVLAGAGAAFWTGVEVANFNLVLELSGTDPDNREGGSMYMAVNSMIVNLAGMLGGVFYGSVAESLKTFEYDLHLAWLAPIGFYEVLFAISAVLRLTAIFPLLRVHEPEARPTVDLLRFIAGNLYNNAAGAVLLPVRLIRRKDHADND